MQGRLFRMLPMLALILAFSPLVFAQELARGNRPSQNATGSIHDLAWQVSTNANLLNDIAQHQFGHPGRNERQALQRFARLRAAAAAYLRASSQYPDRPQQTADQYKDLREAWREAQASVVTVRPTADASRAIGRLRDGMDRLAKVYAPHDEGKRPGQLSYDELRRTARDIDSRAGRVRDMARKINHPSEENRRALDRLADAAENFAGQVEKYHGNIGHIDEEYVELVRRLRVVRDHDTAYSRPVLNELDALQGQVVRLNYIHPGTSVGDNRPHGPVVTPETHPQGPGAPGGYHPQVPTGTPDNTHTHGSGSYDGSHTHGR